MLHKTDLAWGKVENELEKYSIYTSPVHLFMKYLNWEGLDYLSMYSIAITLRFLHGNIASKSNFYESIDG